MFFDLPQTLAAAADKRPSWPAARSPCGGRGMRVLVRADENGIACRCVSGWRRKGRA